MNFPRRFEELWGDYLEGLIDEEGLKELQSILEADPSLLRHAGDSYQTHRLLGVLTTSSSQQQEAFVTETMQALFPGRERTSNPNRRRRFGMIATAALILLLAGWWAWPETNANSLRVHRIHGHVSWTGDGGEVIDSIRSAQSLLAGTLELFSADSWIELRYEDGTSIILSGLSMLSFSARECKEIRLRHGDLSLEVKPQDPDFPMLVHTPSATLEVLGTQFNVESEPSRTLLTVNQGRVRLIRRTDGESIDVPAHHQALASMTDDSKLAFKRRGARVWSWQSDLREDLDHGKWTPDLWALGARLKQAVALGEMTDREARDTYKEAASFDDERGVVWPEPSWVGPLVVLAVSREIGPPVVIGPHSRIRIKGRLHSATGVVFGFTTRALEGGLDGKFWFEVAASELEGKDFDLFLPVSRFDAKDRASHPAIEDKELVEWWSHALDKNGKFEITHVELLPSEERGTGK